MAWTVHVSRTVEKQIPRLPKGVQQSLALLLREMEEGGPVRGDWPNYSKLGTTRHHYHLKKGRPTYVAVWEVQWASSRLIEVTYVGTHEKAPY